VGESAGGAGLTVPLAAFARAQPPPAATERSQRHDLSPRLGGGRMSATHTYIIGRSGTGKSTLLASLMARDEAFALLDPHGDLANQVADAADPNRTIFFHHACPLGFNPLDRADPLTAAEIVSAFKHIWAESWGPRMEYILYNALRLLIDNRATLLHLPRVLSDDRYRTECLKRCADPFIRYFWETEFATYSERFKNEAVAPIQNKVGQFCANPTIRAVLGQKSTLKFDDILNGKTFIANLSGIGREPSHLLGALFVTAIHQAAARRSTVPESDRLPFTLYADEFQNFATDSFGVILSESRKWGLRLVLANQYLTQLPQGLQQAVLGNVGTLIVFRVGSQDAKILAAELDIDHVAALTDTANFEAITRETRDGVPSSPYRIKTTPPQWARTGMLASVLARTRSRYARPQQDIDKRIKSIFP
jgi:hypothetical protein